VALKPESYGEKWRRVIRRDRFKCQYCDFDGNASPGWLFLTVDHVVPQSQSSLCQKFGIPTIDHEDNLVTACRFCNNVENKWKVPTDAASLAEVREIKRAALRKKRDRWDEWWDKFVREG